jgi:hypothetical protein
MMPKGLLNNIDIRRLSIHGVGLVKDTKTNRNFFMRINSALNDTIFANRIDFIHRLFASHPNLLRSASAAATMLQSFLKAISSR